MIPTESEEQPQGPSPRGGSHLPAKALMGAGDLSPLHKGAVGWQGAGGGTGPCCAQLGSGGSRQALGQRGTRCLTQGGHQQSGHPVAPSLLPAGYGHLQHPRVCQGHLCALLQCRAAEKPRWEASPRGTLLY